MESVPPGDDPAAGGDSFRWNPFDLTKVWPHRDFPLMEVGVVELNLNRNPENYFAEVEQAAFNPSSLVPGIGSSPDKVLQVALDELRRHAPVPPGRELPASFR